MHQPIDINDYVANECCVLFHVCDQVQYHLDLPAGPLELCMHWDRADVYLHDWLSHVSANDLLWTNRCEFWDKLDNPHQSLFARIPLRGLQRQPPGTEPIAALPTTQWLYKRPLGIPVVCGPVDPGHGLLMCSQGVIMQTAVLPMSICFLASLQSPVLVCIILLIRGRSACAQDENKTASSNSIKFVRLAILCFGLLLCSFETLRGEAKFQLPDFLLSGLGLRPANERLRSRVMPSLIGWAQT